MLTHLYGSTTNIQNILAYRLIITESKYLIDKFPDSCIDNPHCMHNG